MRNFTFKRQLLFVMFMLLGCLSIQAADDDLIQYANQSSIVKERFNVRVWIDWMKKIEEYED